VLDPPKLGYWMDSPKWDLDGRRSGKAETMADSRNPAKHAPTLDLGQRLSACEPRRKGRAEAKKRSGVMLFAGVARALRLPYTRRPSSWFLPKRKRL
jgi:hypothetical protein